MIVEELYEEKYENTDHDRERPPYPLYLRYR